MHCELKLYEPSALISPSNVISPVFSGFTEAVISYGSGAKLATYDAISVTVKL